MKSTLVAAAAALLSSGALAVPTVGHKHAAAHAHLHHKRDQDIVWVTEFEVETVTVIETVYGNGAVPTSAATTPAVNTPAPVTVTSAATSSTPAAPSSSSSSVPAANNNDFQKPAAPVTTSSVAEPAPAPAPTTTSSVYVPPPAPTTPVATTSASAAAPSAAASSSVAATTPGDGSTAPGATYSGDFTHWDPALGACGVTNSATDAVVAISQTLFDPKTPGGNPNNNPLCGRTLKLVGKDGSTYSATVVDRCVGCKQGDLDLTSSLFNKVTSNGDGRVGGMSWSWA